MKTCENIGHQFHKNNLQICFQLAQYFGGHLITKCIAISILATVLSACCKLFYLSL